MWGRVFPLCVRACACVCVCVRERDRERPSRWRTGMCLPWSNMATNKHVDLGKTSKTEPYGQDYQNHMIVEGKKGWRSKGRKQGRKKPHKILKIQSILQSTKSNNHNSLPCVCRRLRKVISKQWMANGLITANARRRGLIKVKEPQAASPLWTESSVIKNQLKIQGSHVKTYCNLTDHDTIFMNDEAMQGMSSRGRFFISSCTQ